MPGAKKHVQLMGRYVTSVGDATTLHQCASHQIVEERSDTDTIGQIMADNTNKVSASMVILDSIKWVQLPVDTGSARNILPRSLLPMTAELQPVSTMPRGMGTMSNWLGRLQYG